MTDPMATVINLADQLDKAEFLLHEFLEMDRCVCSEIEPPGKCLTCLTQSFLEDKTVEVRP